MTNDNSLSFKALIFDMDGTMIDNMMVHHRAWQQKLKNLGLDLSIAEVKRDVHGVNAEIIKRLFGNKYSDTEIQEIAWDKEAQYRDMYAGEVKLLPGLDIFLKQAKNLGVPMGVGTAAPLENMDFILDTLGLRSYFSALIHAGQVENGKPDPEVFSKVADQLNIPLKECIIFEDSPTGAKAAANGNAHSIILTTTHGQEDFKNIDNIQGFLQDFSSLRIDKMEGLFRIRF